MGKFYIFYFLIAFFLVVKADAQTLVYYNNFNSGQSAWKDYDDELSNAKVEGGKYTLTHKQHTSSIVASPVVVDYNRDYAIETSLAHISGETYPAGLTFFGLNSLNLYYFCLSNGQFTVAAFDKGANKVLVAWTPSAAILPGTAVNKLRVEKSDNQLKYFINDALVAHTIIYQRYGDAVGLMVGGQQSAAFDFLKVTYISPETTPLAKTTQPVSMGITENVYHTDFNNDDQNAWVLPAADSAATSIADGFYKIFRTGKTGITSSVTAASTNVDMHRDYLVETEAVHYSGTLNYGYGLDFSCDTGRQYHFWIAPAGYYLIGYTRPGQFNTMTPWTSSDAIDKNPSAKNKLTIAHKDGQLNFYINDQLVTTFPELKFSGHQFGISASAAQNVGFDYLTIAYLDKAQPIQAVAKTDLTPPEIIVTAPQVTRGLKVVQNSDVLHVAGIAKDPSGIFSVVVNGIQATVDNSGNFEVDVPMALGDNPLMIVATDNNMNKGNYRFNIVRNNAPAGAAAQITQSASQGKFYAIFIGVQDYQDNSIRSLDGPVGDATTLMQALAANYTFDQENITILKNPTRAQFFKTLDDISATVKPEDNLLIFYAGHGYYDPDRHQGYWFPADANRTHRDTWISNSDLIDYITAIRSKHTLLISDACFSGSIFKSRGIEMATKDIQELYKLPSRKAMTSGNMTEVPDNSKFIEYLVKRLNDNTDKFLPSEQLFASFKSAVINNSATQQVPQFGEIREAGDEGGDFIFIKRN